MMRALPSTRLLPPTIALMGALLSLKSVALVRSLVNGPSAPAPTMIAVAQAAGHGEAKPAEKTQDKPAKPAAAKPDGKEDAAPAAAAPPAPSDPPVSAAERAVLLDLRQRRQELDARDAALAARESMLTAAEQKLAVRVGELTALQKRLEALEAGRAQREEASWQGLVKVYETMKPRDAATIFNDLEKDVLLNVLDRMKDSKAALVLAAMNPDRAREATTQLAQLRSARNALPGPAGVGTGVSAPAGAGASGGAAAGTQAAAARTVGGGSGGAAAAGANAGASAVPAGAAAGGTAAPAGAAPAGAAPTTGAGAKPAAGHPGPTGSLTVTRPVAANTPPGPHTKGDAAGTAAAMAQRAEISPSAPPRTPPPAVSPFGITEPSRMAGAVAPPAAPTPPAVPIVAAVAAPPPPHAGVAAAAARSEIAAITARSGVTATAAQAPIAPAAPPNGGGRAETPAAPQASPDLLALHAGKPTPLAASVAAAVAAMQAAQRSPPPAAPSAETGAQATAQKASKTPG